MDGRPPPLGPLLRHVQNDVRATARVDAAGPTDRLQAGHAQVMTLLLRDAVLKRDWSRAAALATAGLVAGPAELSDPRPFFRRADASVELLQLATEVCAQNSAQFTPQLEAAARRQTRKRARLRHDAATAAQEGIQWAAALAVRAGDLDAAKQVAIRVKHDAAAALLAYAQWADAARIAQAAAAPGAGARQVAQLRKAALPLLRDAAAASPNDVLLSKALETLQGQQTTGPARDNSDEDPDGDAAA